VAGVDLLGYFDAGHWHPPSERDIGVGIKGASSRGTMRKGWTAGELAFFREWIEIRGGDGCW